MSISAVTSQNFIANAISWLNANQGTVTALLTIVLIVVTIVYTVGTFRMTNLVREQLNTDRHPNLMVLALRSETGKVFVNLYNHGKYPLYIRGFYLVQNQSLLELIAQPSKVFEVGLSKIEAFESISRIHFLSSHNHGAFGAADLETGSYHLVFCFHYGGTNARVHSHLLTFEVVNEGDQASIAWTRGETKLFYNLAADNKFAKVDQIGEVKPSQPAPNLPYDVKVKPSDQEPL